MCLLRKIRQATCTHSYPDNEMVTCTADNGDLLIMRRCSKCKKPNVTRLKNMVLIRILEKHTCNLKERYEGE